MFYHLFVDLADRWAMLNVFRYITFRTLGAAITAFWMGVLPASFATLIGAALRRWIGPNMFVYILGRAFLGTVASMFAAGLLAQWSGHQLLAAIDPGLALVGRWLMAWGDGFMTGMMAAIAVAFKPHWLATWSDRLYLRKSG